MSRFSKFVIILVIVFAAMLLLTYSSPAIKEFAQGLSVSSKLPLWLVGLAAPILFVFDRIGKLLGGLFGAGPTERGIRETNEEIKAKLAQVEREVADLHQWRTTQIEPHMARIAQLQQDIGGMETRAGALRERVPALEQGVRDAVAEQERLGRELLDAIDGGDLTEVPVTENP